MSSRGGDESLDKTLAAVADYAATIRQNPRSTIEPTRRAQVDLLAALTSLDRELELGTTLGEGGMGIVRLGTQRALDRKVAVKTLRDEHMNDDNVARLLVEAIVTGRLEHPNVVPVYTIGADADGRPLIVLKRIEGVHWGELIGAPEVIERKYRERDALEWNLRTLMQVCRAVHFAHSRGVVHRDLKPENVMVGEFGEVYVMDWGIAVTTRDDADSPLPRASEARELAGTPSYMAPEMLGGDPPRISARTDVYLLGACLHEVLTGAAPHDGDDVHSVVASIARSQPALPGAVPEELARICRRAMEPDPDARFENAEQLRLALAGYLQRRGATRLTERAEAKLAELLALISAGGSVDRLAGYALYSECRFGFREAMTAWRDDERARDGLRRAAEAMIEWELANDEPRAAHALLADSPDLAPELRARVDQAREARAERDRRAAAMAADADPQIGKRTRWFVGCVLSLLWTLAPIAAELLDMRGTETHLRAISVPAVSVFVVLGFGVWARESLSRTKLNRDVGRTVQFVTIAMVVLHLVAWLLGIPPAETLVMHIFMWWVFATQIVLTAEPRLWPTAAAYLVIAVMAARWLDGRLWFMALANGVLFVNCAIIWFPGRRYKPTA